VALTMTWIGLIGGIVIGGLIWELEGAIVLGFLGWLAGMIIKSNRAAAQSVAQTSTPGPGTGQAQVPVLGVAVDRSRWPMEQRVARLEEMVARLEAQLAAGTVAAPAARATPEPPPIPETAAAPAEVAVPAPAPEPEPAFVAEPAPAPTPAPELALPPIPPTTPNPIVAWLTGGNTIARVGLLILFIGFAFLLKYAADQKLFPPELRIAAVAAGGIALLFLGWRLRFRNEGYALGLQGAGVAVLYLTTFGALRLYHLIPPELAFFLLAGIAVFSAILAVRQDAVALAVIGAGGGFLAPILASTGGGSHVMLFSYYLVLNLGILAIAWFRSWRALNLTGFAFTFVIFWVWGERSYQPEHFATTEPFLIAFFLVYVALAVLVAREKPGSDSNYGFRRYVDGTLVFGVPLAAFALQAELTNGMEYGLAISALVTAAFYVALTWGLLRTQRESWKLLAQSFVALAVVFVTLAIPLALDARWTSASWALEGAAIIWIGIRQKRTAARVFGLILQFLAGVAYLAGRKYHGDGIPLVDAPFLGAAIMALAGLWTHRLFLTNREAITKAESWMTVPIFAWGLVWTLGAGLDEIDAHVPGQYTLPVALGYLALLATVFGILANRWQWRAAAWTARALLPAMWLVAIIWLPQAHPFADGGWLAWPLAFATLAWVLRRVDPEVRSRYTTILHAGAAVLLAFLGALELNWAAAKITAHGTAWSSGATAFVPSLVILLIALPALDARWPINDHARAYRLHAVGIIAAWLALWSLFANVTHDARSDPLPYMPIINALDLAHVFAILTLVMAWRAAQRSGIEIPQTLRSGAGAPFAGALLFIWLTAILLRTVSHWGGVPYAAGTMMKSQLVQASLSVFWALLALAAMIFATRTARRPIWIVGAVLMAVVVAKLFLIDLGTVGTVERIVSFIAVGVLMLVIGYFSPVPPRKPENA